MNILLVGCGNIGSRHTEGLVEMSKIKKIYIYDIDLTKTLCLKKKFGNNSKIIIIDKLKKMNINFFLCVVATTSNNRLKLFIKLNKLYQIKFWLFEKIFLNNIDEIKIFKKKFLNNKMFINLPLQLMCPFQTIKKKIKKNYINHMELKGGNWNMASNSLHFIQLAKWFVNQQIKKINISNKINFFPSKRFGYKEFNNEIIVEFKKNFYLKLQCTKSKKKIFKLIINNDQEILYNFKNNTLKILNKIIKINCEFQSEITKKIFTKLYNSSFNNLVYLEDHIVDNEIYINTICKKINKNYAEIT
jgi:hypothetical protein